MNNSSFQSILGTIWEKGSSRRIIPKTKQLCKFEKFIVPHFITIILFQISVIFLACRRSHKGFSHTLPRDPLLHSYFLPYRLILGFKFFFPCSHNDCCSLLSLKQQPVLTKDKLTYVSRVVLECLDHVPSTEGHNDPT